MVPLSTHQSPLASRDAFVAPSAVAAGKVEVWDRASVWYGTTLRADGEAVIRVGAYSNVQDGSVIETAKGKDHDGSVIIGHYVTIGHSVFVQGATIEDEALVGIGAVMGPGSVLGSQSILGAGAVLAPGERVPSGELWVGSPARKARDLSADERAFLRQRAIHYYDLATEHRDEFYLDGDLHVSAEAEGIPVGWKEWPSTQA
jgi:carbonic anhydrase/acetyltransferase-like protein (isoleucine patch superfamily)